MATSRAFDTAAADSFPTAPIPGSALLQPIASWSEMQREASLQGVEFDYFWFDHVHERSAYFFRWLGAPRATVLVIWHNQTVIHIECRRAGDVMLSDEEQAPIVDEIERAFGYPRRYTS